MMYCKVLCGVAQHLLDRVLAKTPETKWATEQLHGGHGSLTFKSMQAFSDTSMISGRWSWHVTLPHVKNICCVMHV